MDQIEQRRKDAAFYCETCPYRSDSSPAAVQCDHSGISLRIAYSVGKCPNHHWDHGGKYVPTEKQKLDPIPRERWSSPMVEWSEKRTPQDVGLGDTLHRIGTAEASGILSQLTPNTKCSQRVRVANELYPYS